MVNKESENLHAEMLLRTLGRVLNNHGSLAGGLDALNTFATQQVGILPGETYFSDGSGLSREDLVAPQAAVKLLLYMARSPHFQAYFDSLPVSGIDGTLAHRLSGRRREGEDSRQDRFCGARQYPLRLHGLALGKTPGVLDHGQQSSSREQGRPGNARRDCHGDF